MKIVATILIYGVAIPLFHMPDEKACEEMVGVMRSDVDAAFESSPFGKKGPNGEIIRRLNYKFECRNKPIEGHN